MTSADPGLLRIAEVRALLGARFLGGLALTALATIVGLQVYELTRSPLALGWLGLVEAIPALGLALFGGHLADRHDRRALVLLATVTLLVCSIGLALIAWPGSGISRPGSALGLAAILAVIFVSGIAGGIQQPASTAFEAQVVPLRHAATGASWLSGVSFVGGILGPVIGGIAYAVAGPSATYGLIAAVIAAEIVCILLIAPKPLPPVEEHEPLRQSLTTGIRFVLRTEAMLAAMALDLFAVLFGGAIALLPIFATDVLHVGAVGLGLMRTAPSVGALVVMLVATRRPPMRRAGASLLIAVAGFGLSILVFALSRNLLLSLAALFMSGLTDGISMIIRNVILRVMSPEHIRGRVASVNWIFIGASNQLGALESGVAASVLGTVPSVLAGATVTLLVVATVALRAPALRGLNLEARIAEGDALSATSVANDLAGAVPAVGVDTLEGEPAEAG